METTAAIATTTARLCPKFILNPFETVPYCVDGDRLRAPVPCASVDHSLDGAGSAPGLRAAHLGARQAQPHTQEPKGRKVRNKNPKTNFAIVLLCSLPRQRERDRHLGRVHLDMLPVDGELHRAEPLDPVLRQRRGGRQAVLYRLRQLRSYKAGQNENISKY